MNILIAVAIYLVVGVVISFIFGWITDYDGKGDPAWLGLLALGWPVTVIILLFMLIGWPLAYLLERLKNYRWKKEIERS